MGVRATRGVYRLKHGWSPFNREGNPVGKPRAKSYYELSECLVIEGPIRHFGCLLPHAVQEGCILEVGEYRYGKHRDIQFSCGVELEVALNLARFVSLKAALTQSAESSAPAADLSVLPLGSQHLI